MNSLLQATDPDTDPDEEAESNDVVRDLYESVWGSDDDESEDS